MEKYVRWLWSLIVVLTAIVTGVFLCINWHNISKFW